MNAKNIFGAFTVAIALFFMWPGIFNSWAEKNALKASLAEYELILAERTDILEKSKTEYAKYQSVTQGATGKNFLEVVPAKKNTAELLSATQAIATNSGILVTIIQFGEDLTKSAKKSEPYETLSITVEGTGTYTALRSFLGNLESYVRILDVRSVQIGQGKQEGTLGFKIQANTYYSK